MSMSGSFPKFGHIRFRCEFSIFLHLTFDIGIRYEYVCRLFITGICFIGPGEASNTDRRPFGYSFSSTFSPIVDLSTLERELEREKTLSEEEGESERLRE